MSVPPIPEPDLRAGTNALIRAQAHVADLGDGEFRVAGLESLVAFKRLADRPRDRLDLLELEPRHGALPIVPLPELDG